MEYGKIVSIGGVSGLFEVVGTKNDGVIARSLEDKSTRYFPQRTHTYSNLKSIEVYTVRDNVMLSEVFLAMQNSKESLPSENDPKAVKAYFEKVYGDIDFDRVYASDMKKMVKWFKALKANNVEITAAEQEDEDEPGAEAPEVSGEEKVKTK